MGAVHYLHNFSIYIPRKNSQLFPQLVAGFGRPLEIEKLSFGLAPLVQGNLAHLNGDFINIPVLFFAVHLNRGRNSQFFGNGNELDRILYLVGIGLFPCSRNKYFCNASPVIGMCSGPGRHHSCEIPRCNCIWRGAAQAHSLIFTFNSPFGKRETARSHCAVLTAYSLNPDITGSHVFGPVKNGFNTQFLGANYHFL